MEKTVKTIEFNGDWANVEFVDGDKGSANLKFNEKWKDVVAGQVIKVTKKVSGDKVYFNLERENQGKQFPKKNVRIDAIQMAVQLVCADKAGKDKLEDIADRILNYIQKEG